MDIKESLKQFIDTEYLLFHSRLVNTKYPLKGIRVPIIKKLAKEQNFHTEKELQSFIPKTYEEVLALGFMTVFAKIEIEKKALLLDEYLQYIDNWATCDLIVSALKMKPNEYDFVWNHYKKLMKAEGEFERRFYIVLLLNKFLLPQYIDEALKVFSTIKNGDYFVDMALAWGYAEAMIKFPEMTMDIIKQRVLPKFIQNKAIQKMRESFRISESLKNELVEYKV